jgi:hypothetical protein
MHTELTVDLLEVTTAELARQVLNFQEITCQAYQTFETSKEYAARVRRSAKKTPKAGSTQPGAPEQTNWNPNTVAPPAPSEEPSTSFSTSSALAPKGKLKKTLNTQTYKYHALADYAEHIRQFGTVDSYSTERVSGAPQHNLSPLLSPSADPLLGRTGAQASEILVSPHQ